MPTTPDHDPVVLSCSEVWGGNDEVDRGVVMQGLDAWVLSKPHEGDAAGGDLHYLSSCATGRIVRVVVADIAGHGNEVAALSARLRTLLRKYMNYVDQSKLVAAMNKEFAGLTDEGRFATAIIATYWTPTGELDITNAGHPPPMYFDARANTWSLLAVPHAGTTDDLPLGIADSATYAHARVRLKPGDRVLLYTDGMVEARRPDGTMLRDAGLLATLRGVDVGNDAVFLARTHDAVLRETGPAGLGDDATLLLLRPNALAPPEGSLALGLRAIARGVKNVARSALPGGGPLARPEASKRNILGAFFDRFNHPYP